MAANLNKELVGICNLGAIGDNTQPDDLNASDQQSNELIELNKNQKNLEMIQNMKNLKNSYQLKDQQNVTKKNDLNVGLSNESSNSSYQTTQDLNNQIIQDFVMQNYLYGNLKTLPEDTKSMNSVMTSLSTRKTFDFLSKVLPFGVLLLIIFLMIHFVLYVKDVQPLNQFTEIICIALACVVFSLSFAFIFKIFCDSKRASIEWNQPNICSSEREFIHSPSNLNNSYVYNNGVLECCNSNRTPNQAMTTTQQPILNTRKLNLINQIANETTTDQDNSNKKQLHYYIDTINNRIYATQLANLDSKTKRYTRIDNPATIQQFIPLFGQSNQQSQINPNQRLNQQINQHCRTNSFNQRNFSKIIDNKKASNQLCIQTINLNEDKLENLVKETST